MAKVLVQIGENHSELVQRVDSAKKTIDDHARAFNDYSKLGVAAMGRIEAMHTALAPIAKYAESLGALPTIASSLERMEEKLIGPATGANRMDTKAVYLLIGCFTFFIMVLGCIILVDKLDNTGTEISGKTSFGSFTAHGKMRLPEDTKGNGEGEGTKN